LALVSTQSHSSLQGSVGGAKASGEMAGIGQSGSVAAAGVLETTGPSAQAAVV
jgi:hypothetical protein